MPRQRYIRNGRAPIPESETTSRVMSSIRGKETRPELALRKALRKIGCGGYRIHWKKVPGRPDIAYPHLKVAVFVHGCFWHSCPYCGLPLPKSHTDWWREKLKRNKERDIAKIHALQTDGWQVLICWEHEISRNPMDCAQKVRRLLMKHEAEQV
jgi:DNA mismatch endonuclease (patch repair protein)